MDMDERVSVWSALRNAWPVLLDRAVKRLDMDWSGGTMSLYWAGDVLRVDIKFNAPPPPAASRPANGELRQVGK